MDLLMYYVLVFLLEQVIVDCGILFVSVGLGFVGGMDVQFKFVDWLQDSIFLFFVDFLVGLQSVDEGWLCLVFFGIVNNQFWFYVFGVYEIGEDFFSGDFDIVGMQYECLIYGLGVGFQFDD